MSKCFPAYPRKRPHSASLDLGVIATAQPGRAWPLVRVRSAPRFKELEATSPIRSRTVADLLVAKSLAVEDASFREG
jgi:hypothetical protein